MKKILMGFLLVCLIVGNTVIAGECVVVPRQHHSVFVSHNHHAFHYVYPPQQTIILLPAQYLQYPPQAPRTVQNWYEEEEYPAAPPRKAPVKAPPKPKTPEKLKEQPSVPKEELPEFDTETPKELAAQVGQVLTTHCIACHGSTEKAAKNLRLFVTTEGGDALARLDKKQRLAVYGSVASNYMPTGAQKDPSKALSFEEQAILLKWAMSGK